VKPQRIEIRLRADVDDPRGADAARRGRRFLGVPVVAARTHTVYKLALDLTVDEVEAVRGAVTDPVLEESVEGRFEPDARVDWVVGVGFRPGVTDNLGRTARVFVADTVGRTLPPDGRVFTETLYMLEGPELDRAAVERLAREVLANELIERVSVRSAREYRAATVDLELPLAGDSQPPRAEPVPLPADDRALLQLSDERTLSLSLDELGAIRAHFRGQRGRRELGLPADDPTDVELECLAQTWSEHCKHKIFNARIRYRERADGEPVEIDSLFRTYIVGVTSELRERLDWLVSVFDDNAGVVRFDDQTNLVYKVETHNSPSALDPYGGAITGIVGVNRDPMGTGCGSALLTNVWGYCFGSPFTDAAEVPEGHLHPRRIRAGVHQGVIDGGNQSGIPYSRGFEIFDERYLGKPLVFCGTVGVMPTRLPDGAPSHVKRVQPGDRVVMVGGRIGKDGIHGATFSSEALHGSSPAQAVQIGDPITQKKMSDMLLEARALGLYRTITDNGAGGLSSSVGEMAELCGGAELDLERAPLKYAGLQPWEILLSEAQERMTLAVPPERVDELLALAARREVEATVVGRFTESGTFLLRYAGEVVGALEMEFLHHGCPKMELEAVWQPPVFLEPADLGIPFERETLDLGRILGDLLASLDLCSKEARWRQYDHEVKGLSVIKPLTGVRGDVPSDCTAMRVAHDRPGVILLAEGIAPRLSDVDTHAMASFVVDLAVRRIVAGGGRLGQIAGLDNFCWPDPVQSERTPDGHYKLAQLVRACRGLADMTRGLGVPCISGKDSMKNDSVRGGVKISIPPTLLFSAIGWVDDARRAMDLTVPDPDHALFLIGETRAELGGSDLYALLARQHGEPRLVGNHPPRLRPEETLAVCAAVEAATDRGLIRAAHAPGPGGLGVALARLCLASDLGLEVTLNPAIEDTATLFSESGSRLLVCVREQEQEGLSQLLDERGVAWTRLGRFSTRRRLTIHGGTSSQGQALARLKGEPEIPLLVDLTVDELRRRFKETLDEL
jgi:phosphoribosylformylglycinamidine synthase